MGAASRLGVTIAVVAVACGGTASSPSPASAIDGGSTSSSSSGSATPDGGAADAADGASGPVDAGENDPRCPPAFEASGHCAIGLTCRYAEGTCTCEDYCGGAPPPPDVDFSHWGCVKQRTDGCPDDRPSPGSACDQPGKSCTYGSCCVENLKCGATWTSSGPLCPP